MLLEQAEYEACGNGPMRRCALRRTCRGQDCDPALRSLLLILGAKEQLTPLRLCTAAEGEILL